MIIPDDTDVTVGFYLFIFFSAGTCGECNLVVL